MVALLSLALHFEIARSLAPWLLRLNGFQPSFLLGPHACASHLLFRPQLSEL